ncbi:small-conductance mechanosensitive channel [Xenococcus sp. PCC 7305]|uniref:mechanosensitive ion channel family protein n=1 Tax=Xenococcus sp. PCC 7305 TaxID=102125 RepID=UPI0002AD08A8|nr:mechanosensitive ion channel family protein [Xenococcus sp. PCC 7305]ELS03065.1 small-conductance mechanosensitive channel [Xenococcus sp. PCC 7305]
MNRILETIVNSLHELLGQAIKQFPSLLSAFVIIFLTRYAVTFSEKIAHETGKRVIRSTSLQLLLGKAVKVGVWTLGILLACVLAFPSVELSHLIGTLGVSSVAIGFAFQDIFKNFLAGIILLLEEPFRIGDEIIIDDYQGVVKHISVRTTQIRTYNGEKVLLPNSTVFTNAVKVFTAYSFRRTDLSVGVDYDTSLPEATKILKATIHDVEGVLQEPFPEIDLVNFGDSSIDFVVRYWTDSTQKQVRYVQTQAIAAIKKAFDIADINIPYPIRTIYHHNIESEQ